MFCVYTLLSVFEFVLSSEMDVYITQCVSFARVDHRNTPHLNTLNINLTI